MSFTHGKTEEGYGFSSSLSSPPISPMAARQPPSQPVIHPLGGLPPEVWEKVLYQLDNDPETLLNCYRTCTTWEKILEPRRMNFLFVIMAPVIKKHLTKAFFKCRQVCRNWRYSVDKSFDDNQPYLHRDSSIHSGVPPFTWYSDTTGVVLSSSSDIQEFIDDFCPSVPGAPLQGNPFFHKTIKLIGRHRNNDQESNRLYEDFTRLISEHGHSIESCVYLAYGGRPESERQMEGLFNHLPNIKSIAILKNAPPSQNFGDANNGLDWLIQRKNLLPQLPDLISINIYLDDGPLIAEMVLLSYGTQIESFHCDFSIISSSGYFRGPVPKSGFKNLRDLDIFDAFGSSVYLDRLLLFELPFLERLSLEYVEVGPRRQAFKSILRIIDKFSGSLKEIRLPQKLFNWESEQKGDSSEFRKSAKVVLSNVKELGVNIEVMECSVKDWLFKKFPNLQTLHVTNYGVMYYSSDNILRKELCKKLLPFWKLIPSLRKITVERAYLEKMYFYSEDFNGNKN